MLRYLDKSWKVLTNLKYLNYLDKNLDAAKSWPKSLNLKNLDQEKKLYLDTKDILDSFQKVVSTLRTISILISLDCWDPQA